MLGLLSKFRFVFQRYPLVIPLLALLGLLSSMSEGLGIGLFAPFLTTMANNGKTFTGSRFLDGLNNVLLSWPVGKRIAIIGISIFVTILLKNVFLYLSTRMASITTNKVMHDIRTRIHQQILRVSLGYLEGLEPGLLINLIGNQSWRASMAMLGLNSLLVCGSYTLVFLILLLLISWKLTLIVGALLALVSGGIRLLQRKATAFSRLISDTQAGLNGLLHETIGGARDIHVFAREPYEFKRFESASEQAMQAVLKGDILNAAIAPLTELAGTAVLCAVLFIAVPAMSDNHMGDLPKIMAFVMLLYRLQPQFKGMEQARINVATYLDGLDQINDFLETGDKPYLTSGAAQCGRIEHSIRFDDVSFRYKPDMDVVLDRVSINIPVGRTTALIGPSGAGKTTIASLLVRFYDPTSGSVRIDDVDLRNFDIDSWRAQIGAVGQHVFLFNDTIRANIAYGKLDATQAEVEEAARMAHAHDFITGFPDGYDTVVGDRGLRLSGGQRQRIALARAIVRRPQIFVLDEATSALDSLSEKFVQEALSELSHSHTIVIIAHRLSTVEQADHMIVMDHGRVVEQGEPTVLLRSDGLYKQLHSMQQAPVALT